MKTLKLTLLALATVFVVSCDKQTETTTTAGNTDVATAENLNTDATPALADASVTPAATTNAADAPVFTMTSDTYDFGDVQANSTTERVVEFTNTGNSPLVITAAKASCGCTVPEFSKEPIAPGGTGTLKVSFKAPATNGKQTKTVTLTTNTASGTDRFKVAANVVGGSQSAPAPAPVQQAPRTLPAPSLGQ